MEREYNRNQRSYRPRRNDSREDYQNGSYERESYGVRRERREFNTNQTEEIRSSRFSGRRTDKPVRFFPNREQRQFSGPRRDSEEGKREYRPLHKRPRVFRQGEQTVSGERAVKSTERREYKGYSCKKENFRRQEKISGEAKERLRQRHYSKKKILAHRLKNKDENTELRLNRYISMGGICSRRDADELIVAGRVKVNDVVVQVVGQKVRRSDKVEVDDVQIVPEKKVYLILNKPKDYVTTVEDPLERKTVMSLVESACKERIYPVGRLDRQTTGVLLFTNDGDLAKKLTHPKYNHKKIYHVFLDKPLAEKDLEAIAAGVELEDGFIKADEISYTSPDCTEVGIEIHSGKNRIVRRIFEHFGYQIVKLDRVYFAGITKKNVPRGKWRFLTPREINMLKVY